MVVPEKASSFNIHPERCCSDMCHYCGLKFGMLDTPLHVSQLKTSKIVEFAVEFTGFSPDACLCDKCFRFLDRKAKNKEGSSSDRKREARGDGSASETSGKEERVRRCLVRNCNREVSSNPDGSNQLRMALVFCSTSVPLTSTGWVQLTFSSLCLL